jgi:hypothetical protein
MVVALSFFLFSQLSQKFSVVYICQSCDGNWTSVPNLENQTTHACVLFSNWGVQERRVGLLNLLGGFHLQIDRPPSSANLGGHVLIMSEPCSGVEAHSLETLSRRCLNSSCEYKVTVVLSAVPL